MKIVVDLDSVRETARLLAGVADEYEAIASSLRHRHGLEGVTGPHRHSVFATLDWTSSRLTSVANAHRRSAADLRMRVERASERRTSPIYAGVVMAASPVIDTGAVALDRDGDGVTDAYAIDRDGDGRHETFVADTDGDGRFDTAFEMDETGELRAASFDADGDGRAEGFLAVTGSGVVRLTDSDLDGYHEKVSWDSPPAAGQPTIMASPRPGFDVVVDPNARSTTPLSVTIGPYRSVNSAWSTTIDPEAAGRLDMALGTGQGIQAPTGGSRVTLNTSQLGHTGPGVIVDPNYQPQTFQVQDSGRILGSYTWSGNSNLEPMSVMAKRMPFNARSPQHASLMSFALESSVAGLEEAIDDIADASENDIGIDQPHLGDMNTYSVYRDRTHPRYIGY